VSVRKHTLRKGLESKRSQLVRDSAKAVIDGGDIDLAEVSRRLQTYDALLSAMPTSLVAFGVIGTVAVSAVVVLALLRIPRTHVFLDTSTDGVVFALSDTISWSADPAVDLGRLALDGVSIVRSSPLVGVRADSAHGVMHVAGGSSSLARLHVATGDAGGEMELHALESNLIEVAFRQVDVDGTVFLSGDVDLTWSEPGEEPVHRFAESLAYGEPIQFGATATRIDPLFLRYESRTPLILRDISVERLGFVRQTSPGISAAFESTVLAGSIRLREVPKTVELRERSWLTLPEARGRLIQLRVADTLRAVFEGSAKQVLVGPDGFYRDLSPSWLEYLYHNRPLALLWSAIGFAWGLAWTTWKLVRQ
jgi:hypothetical protein